VAQVGWGYAVRVAHMPREPTPGAIQKEANCADCGKLTTHEWIKYPATPFLVSGTCGTGPAPACRPRSAKPASRR